MKYFAHEAGNKFRNIFQHKMQVDMCGKEPIVPVEVDIDETGEYFAWLAKGETAPCMIFDDYLKLNTCFEYGMQKAIEAGEGRMVKVNITRRIPSLDHNFFGHEKNGAFYHVYPSKGQVSMCGNKTIIPLEVVLDENGAYFGWWSYNDDTVSPCMIYDFMPALEMCFPYGIKAEIDVEKGQIVKLSVKRKEVAS